MKTLFTLCSLLILAACQNQQITKPVDDSVTVEDAQAFLDRVEQTYIEAGEYASSNCLGTS